MYVSFEEMEMCQRVLLTAYHTPLSRTRNRSRFNLLVACVAVTCALQVHQGNAKKCLLVCLLVSWLVGRSAGSFVRSFVSK